MSLDKKNSQQVASLITDCGIDWSTKKGIQRIELHCEEQDAGHFLGSYRYTVHKSSEGDKPVDLTLHLQANPRQVVEGADYAKTQSASIFRVTIRNGEPHVFDINFDDVEGKKLFFFLSHHPQVAVEGWSNPNMVSSLFKLVVRTEKATVQYANIQEKVDVANSILSMDYQDCKDLIHFLGQIPEYKPMMPMTHVECIIHLLGEYFDGLAYKHITQFRKFWESKNTKEITMRVAFKKAEKHKFITRTNGIYHAASGTVLGSDVDSVIAYFIANPDYYDLLQTDIAKQEVKNKITTGTELDDLDTISGKTAVKRMGRPKKAMA